MQKRFVDMYTKDIKPGELSLTELENLREDYIKKFMSMLYRIGIAIADDITESDYIAISTPGRRDEFYQEVKLPTNPGVAIRVYSRIGNFVPGFSDYLQKMTVEINVAGETFAVIRFCRNDHSRLDPENDLVVPDPVWIEPIQVYLDKIEEDELERIARDKKTETEKLETLLRIGVER